MLARVRSPHVPYVMEIGTSRTVPWLAMSVAGRESLAGRLRREGALGIRDTIDIVLGIAEALQAIHDLGVLHMDLTPSNVMMHEGCVIDFGAAHALMGSPLASRSSYDGTAGYVAPERCVGAAPCARMDVVSLGAVAYRSLIGVRPYADSRSLQAGRCISPKRLIAPCLLRHDIGPQVSDLLLSTLSLDPASRPESPAEFARALSAAAPSA